MKGRFARIFEIWNQRNTEYYQRAFDKLEKKNKTTFNFAAAFGTAIWLVFRKMYGWAALLTLVSGGVMGILYALCQGFIIKYTSIFVFIFVISVVFGFFGNNLYYREVKSKIAKGYAEMEKYNSIDPIGGIILVGVVSPLCEFWLEKLASNNVISENISNLLATVVGIFFIAIPWAVNYKKFHSQESVESVKFTKKSVNEYLEKVNPKHLTVPMGILIVVMLWSITCISALLLLLFITLTQTSSKEIMEIIQQESNKVAEEVGKIPGNSEISKVVTDYLLNN